jgi:hemoglobin
MFEKYGGFASVSKIVMSFYDKVIDSDQIGHFFDDIDMSRLIDHQTKFIASVMGGPASYTADALRQMHKAYDIGTVDYEEMSRLLRETFEEFDVKPTDIEQVMNKIESLARFVITKD